MDNPVNTLLSSLKLPPGCDLRGKLDATKAALYPAGVVDDVWLIEGNGVLGGVGGIEVQTGDWIMCISEVSEGGTHEQVGTQWRGFRSIVDPTVNVKTLYGASVISSTVTNADGKSTTMNFHQDGTVVGDIAVMAAQGAKKKLHWPEPTQPFKFEEFEEVQHYKGGIYRILMLPNEAILEGTREPAYGYTSVTHPEKRVIFRSQKEMEDGRFVSVKKAPLYGQEASMRTRLDDAVGQLSRYSYELAHPALQDALEIITDINDDMVHGRDPRFIQENIQKIQVALAKLVL